MLVSLMKVIIAWYYEKWDHKFNKICSSWNSKLISQKHSSKFTQNKHTLPRDPNSRHCCGMNTVGRNEAPTNNLIIDLAVGRNQPGAAWININETLIRIRASTKCICIGEQTNEWMSECTNEKEPLCSLAHAERLYYQFKCAHTCRVHERDSTVMQLARLVASAAAAAMTYLAGTLFAPLGHGSAARKLNISRAINLPIEGCNYDSRFISSKSTWHKKWSASPDPPIPI